MAVMITQTNLPSLGTGKTETASLLTKATRTLSQRDRTATQDEESLEFRKERVSVVLISAMEIVAEDPSEASLSELQRAIAASQGIGILPSLRVKARKVLAARQAELTRQIKVEDGFRKLLLQAEAALQAVTQGSDDNDVVDVAASAGTPAAAQQSVREAAEASRKLECSLSLLRQALDAAERQGVCQPLIEKGSALVQHIEQDRAKRELAEFKLKQLMHLEDPEQIEMKLQIARQRNEAKGRAAAKVEAKLEERINKLVTKEHHQRWLNQEFQNALEGPTPDVYKLRQLVFQARALKLAVDPVQLAAVHKLEEREVQSSKISGASSLSKASSFSLSGHSKASNTPSSSREDYSARAHDQVKRRREMAESIFRGLDHGDVDAKKLDAARYAVSEAKTTRVPIEDIVAMEKKLARIERRSGPRLQAEETLLNIMRNSVLVTFDGLDGIDGPVIQDTSKVKILRQAIKDASANNASEDLINASEALCERTVFFAEQQKDAAEQLRNLLKKDIRDGGKLEELHSAIDRASKFGLPTLQAERELLRLREAQVQREAAEAELREAKKGQGEQGKARLKTAIQDAKTAGVSARILQAANTRMMELDQHHHRCALVSGDIRRLLPGLDKEPWKLHKLLENAKSLQPWTPELDKVARIAQEKVNNAMELQKKQREAETELRSLLKKLAGLPAGQNASDDIVTLSNALTKARQTSASEDLIREANEQLKYLKREGCQRTVAEHRLRLALNAKDFGEIEKSLREVRALGQAGLIEGDGKLARGDRSDGEHSGRLVEAANSMLKHLGDVAMRRQAAETALLQRIADADPEDPHGDSQGVSAQQSSDSWVKEFMDILHEAKQSGVAPSLIEHAKLKLRQKRRQQQEEAEAMAALKKTLAKKEASTQELIKNIRKVERFHRNAGSQHAANDPTTSALSL